MFKLGDTVELITSPLGCYGSFPKDWVGKIGIVKVIMSNSVHGDIGIELIRENRWTHTLKNAILNAKGVWVTPSMIRLVGSKTTSQKDLVLRKIHFLYNKQNYVKTQLTKT